MTALHTPIGAFCNTNNKESKLRKRYKMAQEKQKKKNIKLCDLKPRKDPKAGGISAIIDGNKIVGDGNKKPK